MDSTLRYFITKCCLQEGYNLENATTVILEIAHQVKALDPTEQYYHVEIPHPVNPTAALIYRIHDWLTTVKHRELLKVKLEQEDKDFKERQQAINLAESKMVAAGKTSKEINYILEACWAGEFPDLAAKMGISKWCAIRKIGKQSYEELFG